MVQGKIRVTRMTGSHQLKPIVTGQAGRVGKESNAWVMSNAPFFGMAITETRFICILQSMGWDFLEVMVVTPIPISPNWHVQSVKELRDGTERLREQ